MADELQSQGHTIYESLSTSETLFLAEQHGLAQIIINHDIEAQDAKVIQQHFPTLQITTQSTTADVLFELGHFTKGATIQ